MDLRMVGHELGTRAILVGRVSQRGDNLSISTELVDVRDNRQIWGEQYNQKFADILSVQKEISQQISEKLQLRLTREEKKRLTNHNTDNTAAFHTYLRGRYFWNKRTPEEIQKSIEYFERAIAEDPSYALAYAGLADAYAVLGAVEYGGLAPRDATLKAKAAALKALEIDATLAEARTALANIKFTYEWDWPGAEREFKGVIELNPSYAMAHHWYAHYLAAMGWFDEALAEEKRAQELDPLSLVINTHVGMVFYYSRRYDQAIEQCQKTLELDPHFVQARLALGVAYEKKARLEEAMTEFQKASVLSGGNPTTLAMLAHAHALSGKKNEAIKILDELQALRDKQFVSPVHLAIVYLGLGEKDRVFEWLERAYEERSNYLVYLKVEPIADNLRSDPRFIALLKKVGLCP
jgi:tetratricopeptide (TPR) repeat protein